MKSAELFRIINWLESMKIKNYSINPDLTVDVDGDVDLLGKGLTKIPIQFGVVTGSFDCRHNQLTTLKGAPEKVGGWFDCYNNQLTSLQGAPEIVGESFYCSYNLLTSLEGAPEKVGESFYCSGNKKKFTEEEVKAICKVGGGIYT